MNHSGLWSCLENSEYLCGYWDRHLLLPQKQFLQLLITLGYKICITFKLWLILTIIKKQQIIQTRIIKHWNLACWSSGLRPVPAKHLFGSSNLSHASSNIHGYSEMVSCRSPKPLFRVRILVPVLFKLL